MTEARQADLEAAYNVRAAIPGHAAIFARWRAQSAAWRQRTPGLLDLAYGGDAGHHAGADAVPDVAQTLDFFPADRGAALHVFIHGGYWQAMDKRDFSFIAEHWTARGVAVAIPNYGLCPAVSLDTIVDQMRRMLIWLHAQAGRLGFDPARVQISGHSAGGQLAAMLLTSDWAGLAPHLRKPLLHSAIAISGLFDLEPLRYTSMNDKIGMDALAARRNSPIRFLPSVAVPLILAVGERESGAFHAQSDALASAWQSHLPSIQRMKLGDCDHLMAVDELAGPGTALFEAALQLLGNG